MLDFMERNFTCSVDNLRAGRLHTLVTSAFSHNDVGSLLATLNSVFSCGLPVAQMSGAGAFARLLLASSATSMLALVGSDWVRARRAQTAARREWWRPPVDPFHDTRLLLLAPTLPPLLSGTQNALVRQQGRRASGSSSRCRTHRWRASAAAARARACSRRSAWRSRTAS